MEINNRMKQFYTEIYREITQRFPQSTYSTLIHSLTQHKFIKSLPSLFIGADYAHNTPPKKKKKSNSTLPFDFALWGAVFQWDGERGSQQESWSYKQESQVHTDVDQVFVQDVVKCVVVFWMSTRSAPDGLRGQYLTGHVARLKKKKSQYNID